MKLLMTLASEMAPPVKKKVGGVDYLIAPVVLVKEGVLNGELLPLQEISAHYEAWNGAPFVIGHPENGDGIHISANDPEILAGVMVGRVFNAHLDGKALKGEVWLNIDRSATVDRGKEVLDRLLKVKPLEVSTAYFRDREDRDGTFNGSKYVGVARNLRPDHLAALLDSEGACSWADGCGIPRVNQEDAMPYPNEHAARLQNPNKYARIRRENNKFGSGIHAIWGVPEGDGGTELQSVRFDKNKFSVGEAKKWLTDHDYSTSGFEPASEPAASSDREASKEVVDALKTIAQGLGVTFNEEVGQMEELIAQILADERLGLNAEELGKLPETVLQKIVDFLKAAADKDDKPAAGEEDPAPEKKEKPEKVEPDTGGEADPPAANAPCADEVNALLKALKERGGPEAVFALIDNLQATEATRKAAVVTQLSTNEACAFTEDQLKAMRLDDLVLLHKSLSPADYSAQGGGNRSEGEQEVLLPPMFAGH